MQQAQAPFSLATSAFTFTESGVQEETDKRGTITDEETPKRDKINMSTSTTPFGSAKGDLGTACETEIETVPATKEKAEKEKASPTGMRIGGDLQEWFTVTDPITNKVLYINSVTHQVVEVRPSKKTERLPLGWISIVNPENGKDVFVNIKKRRVEKSIKDVVNPEKEKDGDEEKTQEELPQYHKALLQHNHCHKHKDKKEPAHTKHTPQKAQPLSEQHNNISGSAPQQNSEQKPQVKPPLKEQIHQKTQTHPKEPLGTVKEPVPKETSQSLSKDIYDLCSGSGESPYIRKVLADNFMYKPTNGK